MNMSNVLSCLESKAWKSFILAVTASRPLNKSLQFSRRVYTKCLC